MNDTKLGKKLYQQNWRKQNKDKIAQYNTNRSKDKITQYNANRRVAYKTVEARAKRQKYEIENKDQIRSTQLLRRYGITLDEYNTMLSAQNGCCLICKLRPENLDYKLNQHSNEYKLVVDHDHSTKKIRGLLCPKCNRGLGYFNDDPTILATAINYLKRQAT